jgi:hypothetical protein
MFNSLIKSKCVEILKEGGVSTTMFLLPAPTAISQYESKQTCGVKFIMAAAAHID